MSSDDGIWHVLFYYTVYMYTPLSIWSMVGRSTISDRARYNSRNLEIGMHRVDDKGFRDARWIPRSNLAQMNSSTVEHVINSSILSKRWLSRKAPPPIHVSRSSSGYDIITGCVKRGTLPPCYPPCRTSVNWSRNRWCQSVEDLDIERLLNIRRI